MTDDWPTDLRVPVPRHLAEPLGAAVWVAAYLDHVILSVTVGLAPPGKDVNDVAGLEIGRRVKLLREWVALPAVDADERQRVEDWCDRLDQVRVRAQ